MDTVARFVFFSGLAFFAATGEAVTCDDVGNDITRCRLEVVQDVCLESGSTNYNWLHYLIIAEHPGYPLKRSLIQFEDMPDISGCETLVEATMYVHFHYAHKPSWYSLDEAPFIKHEAQVHMVLKSWDEAEATSLYRLSGEEWNTQYLALDGSDAGSAVIGSSTAFVRQPARYMAFEVKDAVQQWYFDYSPVDNNGLLMKVENEDLIGHDIRFYSNAYSDPSKHAFMNVMCTSG